MNTRFWSMILAATLVSPAAAYAKPRREEARPSTPSRVVETRFHDHAQVPEAALKGAKKYFAAVLRASGVEVVWHRCAPCPVKAEKSSECSQRRSPWTLVLRILNNRMSGKIFENRDVFGRALPGNETGFGYLADVFYDRIHELALKTDSSDSLLLGVFIAHEIGHLLLGRDSHSGSGIMCVPFEDMQLRRAVEGNLRFTRSETKRIQSDVRKRHSADVPPES